MKNSRSDAETRHEVGPAAALMGPASRQWPAASPGRLQRAFELRYQVYCIECSFLSPEDYPDGVESDEHDEGAAHFYAFDSDEQLVGYVRLVRPDADALFPIQKRCALSVEGTTLPPAAQSAEISRLMVRGDYRRRRDDRLSGVTAGQNKALFAGDRRCEAPQILLSLYRQMYAYSLQHDIGHWYAAMERPLARSLLKLDFAFRPIGPQTDYYGPVAPYVADLRVLETQVGQRRPALLSWLQEAERHQRDEPTQDDELDSAHLDDPGQALLRQVVKGRSLDVADDENNGAARNTPGFSNDAVLGDLSSVGLPGRAGGRVSSVHCADSHTACETPTRDRLPARHAGAFKR